MQAKTKQTIKIFWRESTRESWQMIVMIIGVVGAVGTNVYRPLLYKRFFDVLAQPTPHSAGELFHIVWLIFAVGMIGWAFWRITTFVATIMCARVMSELTNICFDYLHGHAYNFFNNTFVGSLVTKVNRYARSYEKIFDRLVWDMGPTIVTITAILAVLYTRRPILAWVILGWTIFYIIVNYSFVRFKLKYDLAAADAETKTTARLADTITNNSNLKLFSSLPMEIKTFHAVTQDLREKRTTAWNMLNYFEMVQSAFMVILEVAIMWVAVQQWQLGNLTIGDFALIQAYIIETINHVWGVGKYIQKIYEGLADADEMTEILMKKHAVSDKPKATELVVNEGGIAFHKVHFAYHKKKAVFTNFDLTIEPGERVALIGPSGGGKSTIVKLLFRFFDIQGGQITIDGQNIAEVTQDSLRDKLALVPQEPILFHRSLMENIRYAKPDASVEEVMDAARLAHCHEFIMGFPEKYETMVGERGIKLSGGERQRVAIARAILKDAPILVLDEATSSLDSESERYIQDALANLMKDRTTIVVAHRLSTIMQMDRILVLEGGKIVEEGKHQELLKMKQGTYQKLWGIQAGDFQDKAEKYPWDSWTKP